MSPATATANIQLQLGLQISSACPPGDSSESSDSTQTIRLRMPSLGLRLSFEGYRQIQHALITSFRQTLPAWQTCIMRTMSGMGTRSVFLSRGCDYQSLEPVALREHLRPCPRTTKPVAARNINAEDAHRLDGRRGILVSRLHNASP